MRIRRTVKSRAPVPGARWQIGFGWRIHRMGDGALAIYISVGKRYWIWAIT